MFKTYTPKTIFITGASSGLGAALAKEYATESTTLHLCGRNKERLDKTAALCKSRGAKVYTYLFDVQKADEAQKALEKAYQRTPLDLVIANAGVSGGVLGDKETADATRRIMQTNIFGMLNTVLPALSLMRKRRKGQIAIVASLAGYRGMASCPAYSASKACAKAFGEALYGQQKSRGIRVTTICPGFIETPLTDKNKFYMPFLMQAPQAAYIIRKRLMHAPAIIAFPWMMRFGAWIGSCLPSCIALPLFALFPKKEK
ncbi:MAG: SDR family NAD(P)-dependent oxidoreductase [Alphaproteobacteria bacterium]|nr:SDR family NAD(P)-dependent oxidoreductase [Alphaproteobacteria bacterium]